MNESNVLELFFQLMKFLHFLYVWEDVNLVNSLYCRQHWDIIYALLYPGTNKYDSIFHQQCGGLHGVFILKSIRNISITMSARYRHCIVLCTVFPGNQTMIVFYINIIEANIARYYIDGVPLMVAANERIQKSYITIAYIGLCKTQCFHVIDLFTFKVIAL